MMMDEKFIANLRRIFDLNLYEVKIWLALLSRGISTAGELSAIANVPRSRAYDILESLERKGFVVMKLGKPIQYIAVDPKDVVERAKKNVEKAAKQKIKELNEVKNSDLMQRLVTLYKKGLSLIEPSEISGAIKGRDNLMFHLANMIKNAKKEVIIATTEEGLIHKWETLADALQKAKKNGATIKIVAPITNKTASIVQQLAKIAKVKDSKSHEGRFVIVDGKSAVIMLAEDTKDLHPQYDSGVWINSPAVAKALSKMFEHMWSNLK